MSLDHDPRDRAADRVIARLGLLDDAALLFGPAVQVQVVRTTLLALLAMVLLRIQRAEELKERAPGAHGRVLGLDRSPEVKTLRQRLARLAAFGPAAELGKDLARHRVKTRGHAMGLLNVDGHVRAYHGKLPLPKGHLRGCVWRTRG